jgi:hypothetical protein
MQDYERLYGNNEEFSQQRLIDEDASMKEELKRMRNGLVTRRSISSSISQSSQSSNTSSQISRVGPPQKKQRLDFGSITNRAGGSLSVALLASRKSVRKTSFLGSARASSCTMIKEHSNTTSTGHYIFSGQSSRCHSTSTSNLSGPYDREATKENIGATHTTTLFNRVVGTN